VFIDYFVMLGIGGFAWTCLLLGMLWRAAKHIGAIPKHLKNSAGATDRDEVNEDDDQRDLKWVLVFSLILFLAQFAVISTTLGTSLQILIWAAGFIGFMVIVAIVLQSMWRQQFPRGTSIEQFALFAGALIVLLHNQIEMSFFQAASSPVMWLIVGVSASAGSRLDNQGLDSASLVTRTSIRRATYVPAIAIAAMGLLVAIAAGGPRSHQQDYLRKAAATYVAPTNSNQSVIATLDLLKQAEIALPTDPIVYRWQADIALTQVAGLRHHKKRTLSQNETLIVNYEMQKWLALAIKSITRADEAGVMNHGLQSRLALAYLQLGALLEEPVHYERAMSLRRELVIKQRYSWRTHVELADLLWQQLHVEEAREYYRVAIKLSGQQYLDPARQMSDDEMRRIKLRVEYEPSD